MPFKRCNSISTRLGIAAQQQGSPDNHQRFPHCAIISCKEHKIFLCLAMLNTLLPHGHSLVLCSHLQCVSPQHWKHRLIFSIHFLSCDTTVTGGVVILSFNTSHLTTSRYNYCMKARYLLLFISLPTNSHKAAPYMLSVIRELQQAMNQHIR